MNAPSINAVCRDDAFAQGRAQGVALAAPIRAARRDLARLEAFRLQQPRWLPYPVYRKLADRKAHRYLERALAADYPDAWQRLQGLAAGSGLSLPTLCLFNAMEPLLSAVGGSTACPGACSAVAVRGQRSRTGEPILAHNFDYLPLVQPYYMLRDSRPPGRFRSLDFAAAPLAGTIDGINEHGLAIVYNYAFTTDTPPMPAAPISIAIRETLERCRTVDDAAIWLAQRPHTGGGLLLLADATGDIASLELSATRSFVRRPGQGDDALFHTNRFTNPALVEVQISLDAVYNDRAPKPLRGRRLHESSFRRESRFESLMGGDNPLGVDDVARLMSDHGATGVPDDFTPCVHGSYWHTTACLQLLPATRTMRVAYANACVAKYVEFRFS